MLFSTFFSENNCKKNRTEKVAVRFGKATKISFILPYSTRNAEYKLEKIRKSNRESSRRYRDKQKEEKTKQKLEIDLESNKNKLLKEAETRVLKEIDKVVLDLLDIYPCIDFQAKFWEKYNANNDFDISLAAQEAIQVCTTKEPEPFEDIIILRTADMAMQNISDNKYDYFSPQSIDEISIFDIL